MWEWMIAEGLIDSKQGYYDGGTASPDEYANAVDVAYRAATPEQRQTLIDHL